ncbi:hypothetical protein SISSUDRAFT_426998 [Sistotremastrum suecicum HHB10207 ss-3]|uniref:Uncharacterized protein n=1 Tax=Sistotremastrum suecicum HHB10207 ss-3 TaxID=1314776 RepID=A0A166FL49_9AGAM|nr:hypothetical protein SISSUDRAFT_426998 [Sistotremastrum suecicum HHB10207 ss-3]
MTDSSHAHGDRPPPNRILFRPLPSSHSSHHLHQLQPVHLVHIHSRTRAFSMYRSPPSKLSPNKTAGGSAFMQVNPSHFILLAPLRVQVQYTETRSTRILKTYDFLGDSPGGSPISKTRESRMPSVPESRERSSSPPLPTPGPAIFVSPPIPIDCDCSSPDFDMNWHVHMARVRQSRLGERLKRAFAVAAPPAVEQVHVYPPSHSHSQLSHSHDSHAPHDFSQPYTPPWLTLPLRAETRTRKKPKRRRLESRRSGVECLRRSRRALWLCFCRCGVLKMKARMPLACLPWKNEDTFSFTTSLSRAPRPRKMAARVKASE